MDQLPDIIPRAEAEYLLASSRQNFERFVKIHKLRPLPIVGAGIVYRRSEFIAAVKQALGDLDAKRGAA